VIERTVLFDSEFNVSAEHSQNLRLIGGADFTDVLLV
jgi:hypothetical protein